MERLDSRPIGIAPPPIDITAANPEPVPAPISLLPGEHTPLRKFYFALANACTVTSILLGVSAIVLSIEGQVQLAAALLLGCVLMDALDGPLARKFNVSSPFGAQMDSLADMCSFGLAAPIVVFQWMKADGSLPTTVIAPACALVAVCAAIRLARFNVSPKDGRYFSGVPTTLAACVMALSALLVSFDHIALPIGVAVLAMMMVSGFPYAKLGQLRRIPIWLWVVPAVGLLWEPQSTFLLAVAVYLASGPMLWAYHRRDDRRSALA